MGDESVDILMATFNGEAHVAEQIESILAQSHSKWHLYIGDDHSEDATGKICSLYAQQERDKIFFAPFKERVGVISNFSRIADLSDAPYIMLADQDDLWFPDKIELTLNKMRELEALHGAETPILTFSDAEVINNDGATIAPSYWSYTVMDPRRRQLPQLLMQCVVIGCTALFNRALMNLAFPIPPEANMHDYWLGLIAGTFGVIEPLSAPTLRYRHHGGNFVGAVKKRPLASIFEMLGDRKIPQGLNRVTFSKIITAYMIYRRYGNLLDERSKEVYRAFITMKNRSPLYELIQRLRYGFLRGGPLINLHDFIVCCLMGPLNPKDRMPL